MLEREEYMLLRKRKKIKLKQISEALNVSVSMLSAYERGAKNLSSHLLAKYKFYINSYK